jgi:hypothetical protein
MRFIIAMHFRFSVICMPRIAKHLVARTLSFPHDEVYEASILRCAYSFIPIIALPQ